MKKIVSFFDKLFKKDKGRLQAKYHELYVTIVDLLGWSVFNHLCECDPSFNPLEYGERWKEALSPILVDKKLVNEIVHAAIDLGLERYDAFLFGDYEPKKTDTTDNDIQVFKAAIALRDVHMLLNGNEIY